MLVLLTRVSNCFSSLLESGFQELQCTRKTDNERFSMNEKVIFIETTIVRHSKD